jgi:uncharacterized protein (TIGR03084 family)
MDEIVTALAGQHAELDSILDALGEPVWARPSRCAGWTVSDVVLHLAQTSELAAASAEGRLADGGAHLWQSRASEDTVDDWAAAEVAAQRGDHPSEVLRRWRAAAEAERAAFTRCSPSDRLTWVAGKLSARTLATTRLAEYWIHTGDIAEPLGLAETADGRLWHIARLAWRTLPYAFHRAGRQLTDPVALQLIGPKGEQWNFGDDSAPTVIGGNALEFCLLAARRLPASDTTLRAEGPHAREVLELARTFA